MHPQPDWHIETFKAAGSQPWRFRIVGANNETVLPSEGYATRWNRDRIAKQIAKAFRLPIQPEPPEPKED